MSRDAIVFLGPSLPRDAAQRILAADYRPPVAQGDVAKAARERPRVLCLIDGYFERQPAVWHKEILWALSRGVHVVGAASMGALRAAELERFGMVGVGAVFRAFRDGLLHDDDEVALAHGPAESGYRAASEAMVDLRATLGAALAGGLVDEELGRRLEAEAKRRFYPDRRWPSIVRAVSEVASTDDERRALERFITWLDDGGRVEQKRADAEEALRHVARLLAESAPPPRPAWRFQHTLAWDELQRSTRTSDITHGTGRDAGSDDRVDERRASIDRTLAEARLLPDYPRRRAEAVWSVLADDAPARDDDTLRGLDALRARHRLETSDDVERFAEREGLDPDRLLRLAADAERARRVAADRSRAADARLVERLRLDGLWSALGGHARAKDEALRAAGLDPDPTLDDLRIALSSASLDEPVEESLDESLWSWLFDRLGVERPDDLEAWARSRGFSDLDALRRAAVRERLAAALRS